MGGARYFDAATDDARLTLANVIDAAANGAVVLNHAAVSALSQSAGRVDGAEVHDRVSGERIDIRARVVVNATGPWTDSIRHMESPGASTAVVGTKGVHVQVAAARVGNTGAVTMLSPIDGRVMFVLPAGAATIIGTTDTVTTAPPESVRATRGDVNYLLESANAYFPAAKLSRDDVITAWAGIRPLIARGNAGDPAGASREHDIAVGPRGVVAVTGGKLTTYRAMAAQVTDAVQRQMGARITHAPTDTSVLPPVGDAFACTVADLLVRRSKVAFETADHGWSHAPVAAGMLATQCGWTSEQTAIALEDYRAEIARLFTIDD